jgi:hypothetical protein
MAALDVIDFMVSTYGLDVLPALVRGFSRHEDWEALVPAALGVRAAELEAAWHGEMVAYRAEPDVDP